MRIATTLGALALVLAACGGGDAGDEVASLESTTTTTEAEVTTTTVDDTAAVEAQLTEFAQCMRDNGVPDFPDPTIDADGNPQFFPGGVPGEGDLAVDDETLQAAADACSDLLQDVVLSFLPEDSSELEDRFLEFSECMRENGVADFPDPDFSNGLFGPDGQGPFGGAFDPDDPEFAEAADACSFIFQGVLPGAPGSTSSTDGG